MKSRGFVKYTMVIDRLVATGPCYNGSWMEVGLLAVKGLGPDS